jgi:two-component system, OmpR family, sensor histidine kinase SenX3
MRIASRSKMIAFVITLGVCLVTLAVALELGWIIFPPREGVLLGLGVIFFFVLIGGLILNMIFLVREIRRNEQHDSFINAVTHELKTPIASIRLYLETLQFRNVDERQRREFYDLMLQDTERLLSTVEQVLKAGQAGIKRAKPQLTNLELSGLVKECMEVARNRHHLEPGALHYSEVARNGHGTPVRGDRDMLTTAISNVIDNAIKYSGEKVDVSVEVLSPNEERIELRITDHGVGIPPHEVKRVFRRFYRVPNPLTHVKGTGLGLFIVRSIVRKHGGNAWVSSAGVGQGTTVTITLPRATKA